MSFKPGDLEGAPAPVPVVAVAYSGGRDSTALLHASLAVARALRLHVAALHVHHGLSAHADAWLQHCQEQCESWAEQGWPLSFDSRRVQLPRGQGESIEAVARRARYRALSEMAVAVQADLVLLAHHQSDQAETFMLQALRGGGVAGLAAMPRLVERAGLRWARPWLDQPQEAIEAYVAAHRLSFIDDDSNADPRFARNRLRLQVFPALVDAFPHALGSLVDAARWAGDAAALMGEVGQADLATCVKLERRAGAASPREVLDIPAWQSLSPSRARNALRLWFRANAGMPMPASLVERLMMELGKDRDAVWPAPSGRLELRRRLLGFLPEPIEDTRHRRNPREQVPQATLQVFRAGRYRLKGWGGVLLVKRVSSGGVALARLADVQVVPRLGGEQFQIGQGRPARSLKKQYQACGVAAWDRDGPLLLAQGCLVFAPGLGIDARAWATEGEPQVSLAWVPDSAANPGLSARQARA